MSRPRVVISSAGVFHAHPLALAALEGDHLAKFIYAAIGTRTDGIPADKVIHQRLPAAINFAAQYASSPTILAQAYRLGDGLHDRLSSRYLHHADIFHFFNHQGLVAAEAAKSRGILTICERSSAYPTEQHELIATEYANHGQEYPTVYKELVARHLAEYDVSDYIMVCSGYVERSFLSAGVPKEKLLRTTLGFDPTRFQRGEKTDNVFRVVAAGILCLRKGTHYLLEGFKRANIPNSELLFVGDPQPDILPTLEKYSGMFKHKRFVPQKELQDYYHQSSVFALPSIDEGFGMVILEAAACGLPVIITENVGAPFEDKKHGFVLPIRDPDAIAEALTQLYENPDLRQQYADQAYEHAQQFTWARYRQEVREAYRLVWDADKRSAA